MAPKSMTGFARADGGRAHLSWYWEVRTVNGRGLDIRARLPQGFESLEPQVRELLKARLARGSCQVSLNMRREAGGVEIRLNEPALAQVVEAVSRAAGLVDAAPPAIDRLLTIRGVLEFMEPEADDAEVAARNEALLSDLASAIDAVVEARALEGSHLTETVCRNIDEIERLIEAARVAPGSSPEVIRDRLREQLDRLLEGGAQLDDQRLYQEAVLLASKADVHEELDRLDAHVTAARELLAENAPVGRRLEFLTQELNREANTICSKSNDPQLTRDGLALKAVIDRIREQVQNIE